MKKRILAAVVVCAFGLGSANASILKVDNFDYPDGSLVGNGGWTNHSGTLGDMLVSSGEVVVQHGAPSEDANVVFAGSSGNVYYGIDFRVNASAPIPGTDNEYFAHFRVDGSFAFSARLDVVPPTAGGDFSVGIATTAGTADATWATDLTFGTTYRAVVRYDQDANIAELWIDAVLETDTSILGADETDPGDAVDSFALRQSDSNLNETVYVDNLCVGTTFADVVTPCEPVSVESKTWGQIKSLYGGK